MSEFKAEKEIGEPDLEPDSPMVFSLVRKDYFLTRRTCCTRWVFLHIT